MSTINKREPMVALSVRSPGGHMTITLEFADLQRYHADPDTVVAEHLGLTLAEYVEWLDLDGVALCGGRTKKGRPCNAVVSKVQLYPGEWKAAHRERLCRAHGGDE